jgi:argininosuccinate lyase
VRAVLAAVLPALTQLVATLRLDRERMQAAAGDDRLLATELADALAARGLPFRQAHEIVGMRIAEAERKGTTLTALGPSPAVTKKDLAALDLGRALKRRAALGGASPARVAAAACEAARRVARLRKGGAR